MDGIGWPTTKTQLLIVDWYKAQTPTVRLEIKHDFFNNFSQMLNREICQNTYFEVELYKFLIVQVKSLDIHNWIFWIDIIHVEQQLGYSI